MGDRTRCERRARSPVFIVRAASSISSHPRRICRSLRGGAFLRAFARFAGRLNFILSDFAVESRPVNAEDRRGLLFIILGALERLFDDQFFVSLRSGSGSNPGTVRSSSTARIGAVRALRIGGGCGASRFPSPATDGR